MLRAMEVAERAGVPAVGIFGEAFGPMARLLAKTAGLPTERLATYPGMLTLDSQEQIRDVSRTSLTPQVMAGLTSSAAPAPAAEARASASPTADGHWPAVIQVGSLDDIQDHFYANGLSDGLPVIPPTRERVAEFLRHTPRRPDEVIGVLPPAKREATVMTVAVNGVLAGCRPEYMPLLVAAAECLADPLFRLEDAGSTPGWEPLVVVSGEATRRLDLNSGTGVLRVGRRANSTIGRFVRLFMRTVAGFRIPPGLTDQAGFGTNFNVALAEDEDSTSALGWTPYRVDRGFVADSTVVTVQSVMAVTIPIYTSGPDPAEHVAWLGHYLERAWKTPSVLKWGAGYQLLAMSPSIARVFVDAGMSKSDVRDLLVDHTRTSAAGLDRAVAGTPYDWHAEVEQVEGKSLRTPVRDAHDGVRIFLRDDWLGIVVAGNSGRNQSRGFCTNHVQGLPVSRVADFS